jgi:hypothetical protein
LANHRASSRGTPAAWRTLGSRGLCAVLTMVGSKQVIRARRPQMTQKIIRGRRVPALPGVAWPLLGLTTQGDQPLSFCVSSKKPLTLAFDGQASVQPRKRGCPNARP